MDCFLSVDRRRAPRDLARRDLARRDIAPRIRRALAIIVLALPAGALPLDLERGNPDSGLSDAGDLGLGKAYGKAHGKAYGKAYGKAHGKAYGKAYGKELGKHLVLAAADNKLQRCRYLHGRIEHFTRLRRSGGSGAQMERWRIARQRFEEEYRLKRCHRFGTKLKEIG